MWFSCFPVLPGSAEAQVIWGGTVKRLLIAYFIGNISAKKYQNEFIYVKVIANQRWDVFWDTVYLSTVRYRIFSIPRLRASQRPNAALIRFRIRAYVSRSDVTVTSDLQVNKGLCSKLIYRRVASSLYNDALLCESSGKGHRCVRSRVYVGSFDHLSVASTLVGLSKAASVSTAYAEQTRLTVIDVSRCENTEKQRPYLGL